MDILLFSERFTPDLGGVARSASRTARALVALGHRVQVFSWTRTLPAGQLNSHTEGDLTVHRFGLFSNWDFAMQHSLNVLSWLHSRTPFEHLDSEFEKDRWKVKLYINPCLQVSGRLADGNKFRVVVTERQEERSRWARSRSGKSKLKRKTKSSLKFDVTVRPDVDRYGHTSTLDKLLKEAAKVPAPMSLVQAEASDTELRLRAAGPGHAGVPVYASAAETVAMLLLSAYQCLNFQEASLRSLRGASA